MKLRQMAWWSCLFLGVIMGPTLLAQAAQALGEAATPQAAGSEWGNSGVWAFLSTSALEWLKRNPKINVLSEKSAFWMQRIVGGLLAVATAGGIHASFDAASGTLAVSGLVWTTVSEAFGDSLRQFVLNEVVYRVAVKPYKGNA